MSETNTNRTSNQEHLYRRALVRKSGRESETPPARQNRPLSWREWWLAMRPYEGSNPKPRPPWLVVP